MGSVKSRRTGSLREVCVNSDSRERGCFDFEAGVASLFFDLLDFLAEDLRRPGLTHSETHDRQCAAHDTCYDEDPSPVVVSTCLLGI